MYKKLRIICAIISALFLAVIIPAMFLFSTNGLIICGFGAGLFFLLTLIFRKAQQSWEEKHGITEEDEEISIQPSPKKDNKTDATPEDKTNDETNTTESSSETKE